jgi:uncharacterized protein
MRRKLLWAGVVTIVLVTVILIGGLWFATNQLLFPSWKGATKDLAVCKPEIAKSWGEGCGNLRTTHQFTFNEVKIPSVNGYQLPGWLIKTSENGMGPARGAIMMIPAGGSDRREETRYVKFLLSQHLDVLTLDLGCQGESPCPVPGITYGDRESSDVFSTYLYLAVKYDRVYAMGSSVGAASILVALPEMPKLAGVIAENPMTSFQRLIRDAPQSKSLPGWATNLLISLAMLRGRFDGLLSPEHSLPLTSTTPVYFIHSKQDKLVSYQQTQELVNLYAGPKTVWFPDKGSHAEIWDADHEEYETRLAGFLK